MSREDDGLFACRPILCVQSVAESIAYYVGSLGFRLGWTWSDQAQRFLHTGEEAAPTFALVARGPVQLMLSQQSQGAPGIKSPAFPLSDRVLRICRTYLHRLFVVSSQFPHTLAA
jgi:hypothetical protein